MTGGCCCCCCCRFLPLLVLLARRTWLPPARGRNCPPPGLPQQQQRQQQDPPRRCRCCPFQVWPCPSHSALVCPQSFREVDQFSLWVWLELYSPPTQGDLELLQVQPACLAFCGAGARACA